MTVKVGPKGQVVIPKEVRDLLGIRPGDEVEVVAEPGDGVAVVRPVHRLRAYGGMLAGSGVVAELAAERRRDRERDARR